MCNDTGNKIPVLLPLGQRYASAWSEINSRIQARQAANIGYAATTVTAASYIIGKSITPDPAITQDSKLFVVYSIGLVALSWVYVLWVRHNDAIIGLLSAYCKAIEQLDNKDNKLPFPAWHDDRQQLIVQSYKFRKLTDVATTILTFIATIPAFLLICLSGWPDRLETGVLLAATTAGLLACRFVYQNTVVRKAIAEIMFQNVDGKWMFSNTN